MVQSTVDFTANQKRSTYGVNFISNAATLLVVFRVAQKEVTRGKEPSYKHHVVMIEQARWGRNDPNCLEIPGGLLADNENFDVKTSWNRPAMGALREFIEETGKHPEVPSIDSTRIQPLGKPISIYPNISDQQYQFFAETTVSPEKFENIQSVLTGKRSGNANEGEATVVRILPIAEAYERLLENGNAPEISARP